LGGRVGRNRDCRRKHNEDERREPPMTNEPEDAMTPRKAREPGFRTRRAEVWLAERFTLRESCTATD
jgi:hypothetical protein